MKASKRELKVGYSFEELPDKSLSNFLVDYFTRADFKKYISSLAWLKDYSSYSIASMEVYSENSFTFPLITKLVLFWVAKNKAFISFSNGDREIVHPKILLSDSIRFLFSLLKLNLELRSVKKNINFYFTKSSYKVVSDFKSITFLRTDLWYGLRSGVQLLI